MRLLSRSYTPQIEAHEESTTYNPSPKNQSLTGPERRINDLEAVTREGSTTPGRPVAVFLRVDAGVVFQRFEVGDDFA
jgi:hypothetical protein